MKRAQTTLAGTGFEKYTKTTRRAQFLAEMDRVVPWRALCARIEPVYPKAGNGRPPVGVERMLRMYFLQHWFNLSDPAVEEALYDSPTLRAFVGIDLGQEPVPDETNVCKFRHCSRSRGWAGCSSMKSRSISARYLAGVTDVGLWSHWTQPAYRPQISFWS